MKILKYYSISMLANFNVSSYYYLAIKLDHYICKKGLDMVRYYSMNSKR